MIYKLYTIGISNTANAAYVIDGEKTISFLFDENNPDYKTYLAWLEAGNTPLPADE